MKDPITPYISFWNLFRNECNKNNLSVAPYSLPFSSKRDKETGAFVLALSEPIHLQNWPENSASKTKKIDILIKGTEYIDATTNFVVKSNVSVNYFDASKRDINILIPLESIHYDYEEPCEAGHPIFHAQLSAALIKEKFDSFNRFQVKDDHMGSRLKGIRIPTAHMSLVTVLIGLVADHSPRKKNGTAESAPVLEAILAGIKEKSFPLVCCSVLQSKMKDRDISSFKSSMWYSEYS